MVREKAFVGSNVQGDGVLPAEGGEKGQFGFHLYPGMEPPGVHSLGKQTLSDLLQLRPQHFKGTFQRVIVILPEPEQFTRLPVSRAGQAERVDGYNRALIAAQALQTRSRKRAYFRVFWTNMKKDQIVAVVVLYKRLPEQSQTIQQPGGRFSQPIQSCLIPSR